VVGIENDKNWRKRHEMKSKRAVDRRLGQKHKAIKVDKDKIVTKFNDSACLSTSCSLCIGHEIPSL
jgi:hypothetical protein